MSNKTIAKFLVFVILASVLSLLGTACAAVNTGGRQVTDIPRYAEPETTGKIRSAEVVESSGIAASKCQSEVLWTHNDSGDRAFVYAFNRAGENLGIWLVPNAENRDWEDIATWKDKTGRCFIYFGEIGDNKRLWPEHAVIRIPEPSTPNSRSARSEAAATLPAEIIRFVYPDGDHDAEALLVHPRSGDIFIVTKNDSGPAIVYRINGDFENPKERSALKIAEFSLPAVPNGMVTGGDISPDGRRVVICDYRQAYEFELPEGAIDFDEIWKQRPYTVDIGKRKTGEAVCYSVDGTEIFATSEGRNSPIISVRRLK